jgi:hypothetical protein
MHGNHIIQIEVFHINFKEKDLAGVIAEAVERAAENFPLTAFSDDTHSGIKTVIRFYDDKHIVMNCMANIKLYKERQHYWMMTPRSTPLTNAWARWRINRLEKALTQEREHIRTFAQIQLKRTSLEETVTAVEKRDWAFRLVRDTEWHDLVSQIKNGAMWIFTFEPTDILQSSGLTGSGYDM